MSLFVGQIGRGGKRVVGWDGSAPTVSLGNGGRV